jgi:hypothetical protein
MQKKQIGLKAIFLVSLITILIVLSNCVSILEKDTPPIGGIDICVSGITTFNLSKKEKENLKRNTKENIAHINCVLHTFCNFKLANSNLCETFDEDNQ